MLDLIEDGKGGDSRTPPPVSATAEPAFDDRSCDGLLRALRDCESLGKAITDPGGDLASSSLEETTCGGAVGGEVSMPTTELVVHASREPPHPGSTAGPAGNRARYQILGEIARGGMGVVFWGRDGALNRDLAVKILLERHREKPDLRRRFLDEAQIGGQLQHPGIVPIYDLGTFTDDRPFFAMKLVRGRTLSALLKERKTLAADLPRFLVIFQQISQAIAYAHSKCVIHRDLKPSNVMVGAFGEVQVMDWGLAKVLSEGSGGAGEVAAEPKVNVLRAEGGDAETDASVAGAVMGTPAYMSPEQANGQADRVDARADVFGLGSILCEILTGAPAYSGPRDEVFRKARDVELGGATARLDGCGADPELIAMAKTCLSVEPGDRPRDASAVARAMTAHLAGVQDRLRASELARIEAQAGARAERMRRNFTIAMASVVLLGVLVGGGSWFSHRLAKDARIVEAERLVGGALVMAEATLAEAERADVADLEAWDRAAVAAEKARTLLAGRTVRPALREQVARSHAAVAREAASARARLRRIEANRLLADRLDDARLQGDAGKDVGFDSQAKTAAYARVFREAGIDLTILQPREAAPRLKARGSVERIAAALDDWAFNEPDEARKDALLTLARTIDPDPFRNRIRQAIASRDRAALIALTREDEARALSATGVVLMADHLAAVGGRDEAVAFLTAEQSRYPDDFWMNQTLGYHLGLVDPPRRDEAVRFLTVAVALRPRSPGAHYNLGRALSNRGDLKEAVASFREAIRHQPRYADARLNLAIALIGLNRMEEAVQECEAAIRLKPGDAYAYHNLGYALLALGKRPQAIDAFREALRLAPGNNNADVHQFIGFALMGQGKRDEAIAAFRTAIKLKPDGADAHHNLGYLLTGKGKLDEAIAELREARRLKPEHALIYMNLGSALSAAGKLDEALEADQKATKLEPENADAQCGLGQCLRGLGRFPEALAAFRRGHELGSSKPGWYYPSAEWIRQCERLIALGDRLGPMLKGEVPPANDADRLVLAQVCDDRRLFAAAARFWGEALADDPKLADDRIALRRYHAACAAIAAGLGQGEDRPAPDDAARAALRRQGRNWLRGELASLAKLANDETAAHRATVVATLRDWKSNPRLQGVLDADALSRLPEEERKEWTAFRGEVDALEAKSEGRP